METPMMNKKEVLEKICDHILETVLLVQDTSSLITTPGECRKMIDNTYKVESLCYFVCCVSGHSFKEVGEAIGVSEKDVSRYYRFGKRRAFNKKLGIAPRETIRAAIADETVVDLGITLPEFKTIFSTIRHFRMELVNKRRDIRDGKESNSVNLLLEDQKKLLQGNVEKQLNDIPFRVIPLPLESEKESMPDDSFDISGVSKDELEELIHELTVNTESSSDTSGNPEKNQEALEAIIERNQNNLFNKDA